MRKREITGFVFLCLLMGSFWIPKRLLVGEISMLAVTAIWSWLTMAVALVAAVVLRLRWPNRREWRAIAVISVLMLMVPQTVLYLALRYLQLTPVMSETLRAADPLFLLLMAPVMKAKGVPRGAMQWMLAGFGGVLLLFDQALRLSWQNVTGIVAAMLALLLACGMLHYVKRTLQELSPVLVTGVVLILPSLALLPIGLHSLHGESIVWRGDMRLAMALMCATGMICSVLAMWLLQCTDAYRLMMIRVAVPVVMMAESWAMLHVRPRLEMATAAVLVLLSVVSVLRMRDDAERTMTIFAAFEHEDDTQATEVH